MPHPLPRTCHKKGKKKKKKTLQKDKEVYDYSEQHPHSHISFFFVFRIKALLHKERTWPKNLSGSGMVRQDDETLFFSGNS